MKEPRPDLVEDGISHPGRGRDGRDSRSVRGGGVPMDGAVEHYDSRGEFTANPAVAVAKVAGGRHYILARSEGEQRGLLLDPRGDLFKIDDIWARSQDRAKKLYEFAGVPKAAYDAYLRHLREGLPAEFRRAQRIAFS